MLILITGSPGSFKTAMGATKAKEYAKSGRKVYHNINGLNGDNLFPLPDGDDWTTTEDGSVVIYDEAQMFDWLQYKGREKLSTDHRVKNLETHRHSGHDILLITQNPSFIHNHVLSLVGEHHHLHRAFGRGFADVFLWRYVSHTPNSSAAKNKAESHHKFKPNSSIFDEYKSTTIDTHKLKIPPIFFKLGAFLILVIAIILYMVFGSNNPFLSASSIKANADAVSGKQSTTVLDSQASSVKNNQSSLDLECRKGANVEKPECVEWFNNLSKNNGSVSGDDSENLQVSYNPNKPFDQNHIQEQIRYEVTAKPVFSGCMRKNGKNYAYSQQGTLLKEVSQADCNNLLENNDRPFNYFKKEEQFNAQFNNQINPQNVTEQTNKPTIQKETNYANNYVEPHLQAHTTNGANDQQGFNNGF